MPEALVAALDELEAAYTGREADPAFAGRARPPAPHLLRPAQHPHRGAAVRRARRRRPGPAQARGPQPHRLAQDQQRARPGAAHRSGWASRGSSPRPAPASTASPRATAAALLGLECVVYMGEEDTRRQALNVARMRLLGAEVDPGHGRLAHPQGRDQRGDARLGDERRDHPLPARHRRRPAPVPDDGPRLPPGHRRRGRASRCSTSSAGCPTSWPPASAAARNAIGIFHAFLDDAGVALLGLEAGGDGVETGRHASSITGGAARRAARQPHLRAAGRGRPDRSRATRSPPAWTTPASARSTPGCTRPAAPRYEPVTDAEAMEAFRLLCRTEGIIPAIESAHALAGALRAGPPARPGRRRPGQPLRPRRQGRRHRRALVRARRGRRPRRVRGAARRAAARRRGERPVSRTRRVGDVRRDARAEGRAALVGYLPVGFPDVDDVGRRRAARWSRAVWTSSRSACPYSDPLMDGPVIQHAVEAALRARHPHPGRARRRRAVARRRRPGAGHDLLEPGRPVRRRAVRRRPRRRRRRRADHPRPDPRRGRTSGSPPATQHDLDRVFLVAPSSTDERLRRDRRGPAAASSTRPRRWASPGSGRSVGGGAQALVARTRAPAPTCRSASGSASRPARRPPRSPASPTASSWARRSSGRCADGAATPSRRRWRAVADGCAGRPRRRASARAARRDAPADAGAALAARPSRARPRVSGTSGPFPVRAYALCILVGIVVAVWLGDRRWRARGGRQGVVLDIAAWAVPFGIVGGRLYHVVTSLAAVLRRGRAPDQGAVHLAGRPRHLGRGRPRRRSVPGSAPAARASCLPPLADAARAGHRRWRRRIGRWGNWFNNELYGGPTDLPWGLQIHEWDQRRRAGACSAPTAAPIVPGGRSTRRSSTSRCGTSATAGVLHLGRPAVQARPRPGVRAVRALYTIGRGWIEALRVDPANHVLGLRLNMWTSRSSCSSGAVVYLVVSARRRPGRDGVLVRPRRAAGRRRPAAGEDGDGRRRRRTATHDDAGRAPSDGGRREVDDARPATDRPGRRRARPGRARRRRADEPSRQRSPTADRCVTGPAGDGRRRMVRSGPSPGTADHSTRATDVPRGVGDRRSRTPVTSPPRAGRRRFRDVSGPPIQ